MINVSADHNGLMRLTFRRGQSAEYIAAGFFDALDLDIGGYLDAGNFEAHRLLAVVELILQLFERLAAAAEPFGSNIVRHAEDRQARAAERTVDLKRDEFAA